MRALQHNFQRAVLLCFMLVLAACSEEAKQEVNTDPVTLFSWWLQPENKTVKAQIYVHDSAKIDWDHPSDDHLIDGRDAWYVVGSDLIGAMGPTLVSFAQEADALELAAKHGGRVLRFDDVDLYVLQEIGQAGHQYAEDHGKQIRESMGVGDSARD